MTWREISSELLEKLTDPLLVDVRSPCEHANERIPGSVNLPLLSDEERAVIGTIYAEEGELVARREALRFITPKISPIVDTIVRIRKERQPTVVHCWRGGLRSEAVASVLSIAGIDCFRLTGGYKAWRNYLLSQLKESRFTLNPVVLQGLTGVGKTDILKHLSELGASVLDLESLAHHRGSVFGSLGLGAQPTQKNFEAELWFKLRQFENEAVFLEAEGRKIGQIAVPDCILKKIQAGKRILVTGSLAVRRARILATYANELTAQNIELALSYLGRLKERLGARRVAELTEFANAREIEKLVDALLLEYYDPLYRRQIEKGLPYDFEINGDDPESAAQAIYNHYSLDRSHLQLGRL
ncbi:MAG: tRNA 2-selenouridine(34) synthase MnmH [Candidatus Melainabacteria bacterium]|nr:MAG: tRNA 2-selenouridine(34) synthase MnmH [Candidatus Melainabacteria bacterium]